MIKIKLLDVQLDEDNNATFGTCDICMSYGHYVQQPTYIFQDVDTNETYTIEGYWWDWGDYDELVVDNVIDFADWISQQDFEDIKWEGSGDIFTFGWLQEVVWEYDKVQRAKRETEGYKW